MPSPKEHLESTIRGPKKKKFFCCAAKKSNVWSKVIVFVVSLGSSCHDLWSLTWRLVVFVLLFQLQCVSHSLPHQWPVVEGILMLRSVSFAKYLSKGIPDGSVGGIYWGRNRVWMHYSEWTVDVFQTNENTHLQCSFILSSSLVAVVVFVIKLY